MKRLLAILLVALFLLPTATPWLPQDILDRLHTQQEAHHQSDLSHNHHDDHHPVFADESHPAHFDIVSYFDNLHVDLKNPSPTQMTSVSTYMLDMPFILATDIFADTMLSWTPRQSQGPPIPPAKQVVSFGVPVYLATQRIRI